MPKDYRFVFRNPTFTRAADGGKMPNTGGWQDRHLSAIRAPSAKERAIVAMIEAWADYADLYQEQYGGGIGEDYLLGPAWAEIGASIRKLFDGETGRLDCGTLDSFMCDTLRAEGFGRWPNDDPDPRD